MKTTRWLIFGLGLASACALGCSSKDKGGDASNDGSLGDGANGDGDTIGTHSDGTTSQDGTNGDSKTDGASGDTHSSTGDGTSGGDTHSSTGDGSSLDATGDAGCIAVPPIDAGTGTCTTTQPVDMANWVVSDTPNHFTANTNGTVTDSNTGLTWMQGHLCGNSASGGAYQYTYADAQTACPCGWRLPQRIELLSIVDYTRNTPAVNTSYFAEDGANYWSATASEGQATYAWYVSLDDGSAATDYKTATYRVRCVHGGKAAPATRYTVTDVDAGDFDIIEVTDNGTGLIWNATSDSNDTQLWGDAQSACASPWRLPSISELNTLVVTSTAQPAIDANFATDTINAEAYYWSTTPAMAASGESWYVEFYYGSSSYEDQGNTNAVRCVR